MPRLPRFLRPLTRAVTYTRWLHMLVGAFIAFVCGLVYPGFVDLSLAEWALVPLIPVPLLVAAAMVPAMRLAEGLQARVMLFPGPHARVKDGSEDPGIAAAPSTSWSDRGRTAVWMVLRLEVGCAIAFLTGQLMALSLALVGAAAGSPSGADPLIPVAGQHWAYALLVPVAPLVLVLVVAAVGPMMAAAARRLLGPSPKERLAALEERTEQLLERNRIARELHDSIGHALTVAVVQAGAARAAADPEFTERALDAIEETGRAALEDLERVLLVLREAEQPVSSRPALGEADRLFDSARASGAKVDAEVTGPLDQVPGPVSREGYRMLQEALTNVLRHAGAVPVRVRITVERTCLLMDVRSPLPTTAGAVTGGGSGSGLRGIRERAALLGGHARAGQEDGEWQVHVELPLG
ncbi:sensor histidine kinase [Streptomyces jeddahensis]|nr:histidine kinase [Streptomyces jeddahensis]